MSDLVKDLVAEMGRMPIVDGHLHLDTEEEMLARPVDVFHRLTMYTYASAQSAGMPTGIAELRDVSIPIEQRWSKFRPYLDAIHETGVYLQMRIAIRDLYGVDDLTDETYLPLQEKMLAATKPGFYDWILRDKCHIERFLNQGSWNDGRDGFAVGVSRAITNLPKLGPAEQKAFCDEWAALHGGAFAGPVEMVDFMLAHEGRMHAGIKIWGGLPEPNVTDPEAAGLFEKAKAGTLAEDEVRPWALWVTYKAAELAGGHHLVVAAHCGILATCGGRFDQLNALDSIPMFVRCPDTSFDLYHGNMPWMRELAVIANQYPNVHLNLTWCHQLSPYMTERLLSEWLDLVPINKIIGFGGDHSLGVEKIYGALVLARENIAGALADRIRRGRLTGSRAVDICRQWLYDNPKRIYNLS